jgi:hypothetical protein
MTHGARASPGSIYTLARAGESRISPWLRLIALVPGNVGSRRQMCEKGAVAGSCDKYLIYFGRGRAQVRNALSLDLLPLPA